MQKYSIRRLIYALVLIIIIGMITKNDQMIKSLVLLIYMRNLTNYNKLKGTLVRVTSSYIHQTLKGVQTTNAYSNSKKNNHLNRNNTN
jgi:hypothetical protein